MTCTVPGCDSSDRDFGTVLFGVPTDDASRQRWTQALGKFSLPESSLVCWNHFESSALLRAGTDFQLEPSALPKLFLGVDNVRWADRFCRFCAERVEGDAGSDLSGMLESESSRLFVKFLLDEDYEGSPCRIVCDECRLQVKLALRFIRNVGKATRKLDRIARANPESEVKTEMDEFGEIPIGSVEPEVKVEVSSLAGFSDRDDSDYEDNIPLARRIGIVDKQDGEAKRTGPLSCAHCDFTCSKPKQLAGHRKKHKNLKRLPSTTDETNQPLEEEGREMETTFSGYLQCSECPYTCERLVQLASHKKKHTGRKNKADQPEPDAQQKDFYECEFCDFTCKQRRQMAGHRASHSNMIKKSKPSGKERDHMCSICGKILSTRGSFFVHMKYHNDQRDYSCKVCGKQFYSKRDVAMHVESIHEKKVFECEICGVKCTWKNALYKHMRKHDATSFKHECSYCGKKFIAANELRVHIWRHTGQQLNCEICGAGYRFNFLLTQHKIREHGAQIEGVKLYKRFQKGKGKGTAKRRDQPAVTEEQQQQQQQQQEMSSDEPNCPPVHVEHHPTQLAFQETPDHGGSFQQVSNY